MNKVMKYLFVDFFLVVFIIFSCFVFINDVEAEEKKLVIKYTTHVQNIGWQSYVKDGAMAGTSGLSYRLEGIKIKLENQDYPGDIEYRTHVQNIGWQDYVKNNEMAGTSGLRYRLEAIQIRLTGEMAEHYDVYYRVHAQYLGWMNWAKNDELAGTAGLGYRLEGIEIVLVEKGNNPPVRTNQNFDKAYYHKLVKYTTHVQNIGWQNYVKDGAMAGTTGLSYRLEGIKIELDNQDYSGDIEYRTHVQNIGWQDYVKNGAMAGTEGLRFRLEAIQIRLTGEMAEHYDVYYRVHAQYQGWMNWAKNDEMAGTSGFGYRLEGIEIVLVEKGQNHPGTTERHYIQKKDGYYIIDNDKGNIQIIDFDYLVEKDRNLRNQIKGYYWYLEGHDAYIKSEEDEWNGYHFIDFWPVRMEYYKGKIVALGDEDYQIYQNDTEPRTENLHNLLNNNLIIAYDMYINNEKLYMNLNDSVYVFEKSINEKPVILSINTKKLNLNRGETKEINLDVKYYNTKHNISVSSLNTKVAACGGYPKSYNGHIKISCEGRNAGNATVRIEDLEGGNYVDFSVTVNYAVIHPEEIKIYDDHLNNISSLDLIKDDLIQLNAMVYPVESDNTHVTWSSSNKEVVYVNDYGRIYAKSKGTAIITVTSEDNQNIKANCIINVSNHPLTTTSTLKENSAIVSGAKDSAVDLQIRISGGTERYSCDYVRIYKDNVIVKEDDCNSFQNTINDWFTSTVYPAESGVYYADYQFHDSDGEISEGVTNTVTITDN